MEILNECSDVDEIKFQEDGSWCPMRPKKEALKVSSPQSTKIESMYIWVLNIKRIKISKHYRLSDVMRITLLATGKEYGGLVSWPFTHLDFKRTCLSLSKYSFMLILLGNGLFIIPGRGPRSSLFPSV